MVTRRSGTALPGLFSTHRGRTVRRWIVGLFAASILMMMVNNATQGESASQAQQTAPTVAPPRPPKVEAPVYDPFDVAVPANLGEASLDSRFQEAVSLAASGVSAFATYSYQGTPDGFVATIPQLRADAAESLLETSKASWGRMQATQAAASIDRLAVRPRLVETGDGAAVVVVSVAQTVSASQKVQHFSRAYTVGLSQDRDAEGNAAGPWFIDSIVGG